ncbi:28S ribosomal protein S35, mitochondrial [Portunus trituberculatus]|uniref:28S ribosomal protein S35, mitochondrial n=1 Tax=Portunus trituberculatus TaxID=210409 RepID=A0A5B7DGI2_PORTR|nr:28S ribosomal protein S35, mitochondrial [Portunus trituberculatus]
MAGGESLRAVLLKTSTSTAGGRSGGRRGASSRGTSSHVGVGVNGGGLTWRSLRSVSGTADTTDPQGHFFPAKLALSLGLIKLFLAILMVVLGALALVLNAAMATLGVGLWAGAVAGLAGFLGVCSSRRPYVQVYVVSFMCVAILCIVSSGLVIILSATAWARDNRHQRAVYVDQKTEPWEHEKELEDHEKYIWKGSPSQAAAQTVVTARGTTDAEELLKEYEQVVTDLHNEGEDETTVLRYQESVMKLLGLIDPQDTATASEPKHVQGEDSILIELHKGNLLIEKVY